MLNIVIVLMVMVVVAAVFAWRSAADWYIRSEAIPYVVSGWLVSALVIGALWRRYPMFAEQLGFLWLGVLVVHIFVSIAAN